MHWAAHIHDTSARRYPVVPVADDLVLVLAGESKRGSGDPAEDWIREKGVLATLEG
jgi:hypothetical protein